MQTLSISDRINFSAANLRGANFIDASLVSVDLRNANFRNCNISDIDLREARMPDSSIHP